MASDLLQALLGSQYKASDDPLGLAATAIGQSTPLLVNPYSSPTANIATSVGAGLVAALLAGLAKNDAAANNAHLADLQAQFMATDDPAIRASLVKQDPTHMAMLNAVQMESDLDAQNEAKKQAAILSATKPIENKFALEQYQAMTPAEAARAAAVAQATIPADASRAAAVASATKQIEIEKARQEAAARIAGENDAWNQIGGGAATNPASPLYKVTKDRRDLEQSILDRASGRDETKQMSNAVPILATMEKAKGDNSRAADLAFLYGLPKLLDPSVVKEGEMQLMMQNMPGLEQYAANIKAVFSGDGKLDPGARSAILAIARKKVDALGEQYNAAIKPYAQQAADYQLDASRALPFPLYKSAPPSALDRLLAAAQKRGLGQ